MTDVTPPGRALQPQCPVLIRRTVLWGECDPAGVVYTPRYSDYVAETYLAFMDLLFASQLRVKLAPDNLSLPAKAIEIEFRRSLRPNEAIELEVTVGELRTRTFDIDVTARVADGAVAFTGSISLICVDKTLWQSRPLPTFLKDTLSEYREQCLRKIT